MEIKIISKGELPVIYIDTNILKTMLLSLETTLAKTKEIQFYGKIIKHNSNLFQIKEILFTPQINSYSSVESDDDKFPEWLSQFSVQDRLKLRMYGHTHVNMSTTPSATDVKFINDSLEIVDDFYIQLILNNKKEYTLNLFDLNKNLAFYGLNLHLHLNKFNPTSSELHLIRLQKTLEITAEELKILALKTYTLEKLKPKLSENTIIFNEYLLFDFYTSSFLYADENLVTTNGITVLSNQIEDLKKLNIELNSLSKPTISNITTNDYSNYTYNYYNEDYYSQNQNFKVSKRKHK